MKGLENLREGADVDEVLQEVVAARRSGSDAKEMFGGPRDWIDSFVPTAGFGTTYLITKDLRLSLYVALGLVVVLMVVRLAMRETLRHAFSGVFAVVVAAVFAAKFGAKGYFLPGIITQVLYAVAFLVSALLRHPLVGIIMRTLQERPKAWHDHPVVKRAYTEVTLGWAGVFLLRAAVMGFLYKHDAVGWLTVAKGAMGYPLFLGALAVTAPYVRRRTASVPVPESADEGDAEAGGEDAEAETA